MMKKIIPILLLIISLFLQSCGNEGDKNLANEKENNSNNKTVEEKKVEENIKLEEENNNDKNEVKVEENINVNNNSSLEEIELDDSSLEKLEEILKIDNDFYLFKEEEGLENKKDKIIKDIKELASGEYLKRNNDGIPYNVETYKESRLKLIDKYEDDANGNQVKSGKISLIKNEINLAKSLLTDVKKEEFEIREEFNENTGEFTQRKVSKDEAEKYYNIFLKDTKNKIKELESEEKALNSGLGIEKYIYQSKDSISSLLKNKQDEYRSIIKNEYENSQIEKIKKEYTNELSKLKSEFNIKEIEYIVDNVLKININKNNYIYLDESQILKIIKGFEEGNLTKIKKNLKGGLQISSEILYFKDTDSNGNVYYTDEMFYINAKKSLKNGFKNFIVYTEDHEDYNNNTIYHFLTGYDKNESFYTSLMKLIINNVKNDLFIQLINVNEISTKSKEGVIYNKYIYDYNKDLKGRTIIINTLMSILEKKNLENYDKYKMKELLEYFM